MTPAELRAQRQALGLTQEQLARVLGVAANTVARWERGVRNIARPALLQLALDGLENRPSAEDFPSASATRAAAAPRDLRATHSPHVLGRDLSSFIGREEEITQLVRLLGGTYLLTLTGAGGIGKTRLALRVAHSVLEDHPYELCLVELAPLVDTQRVPEAVASALGVRPRADEDMLHTLTSVLRTRDLLLVLDNCEHVLGACADLADCLLRACPLLRILATSREPLGVQGETVWRVPSLSLPDRQAPLSRQRLERFEAVRLFVDRAQAALPTFRLTERNAQAVAAVCLRLDGIPLAIELAASRLRVLSVDELARRLDDSLRLLVGGSRTSAPRQQTLRATIEWSYDLLSVPERRIFERLAVFSGGWTLEAAEEVCAGAGIEGNEIVGLLARLLDKSLVVAEPHVDSGGRYWLLETLRQFAYERLMVSGESTMVRRRHAHHVLQFIERAERSAHGPDEATWREQLEREFENVRAALRWALDAGDGDTGLRLATALAGPGVSFWELRGSAAEGREWLFTFLNTSGTGVRDLTRARALHQASFLLLENGDLAGARPLADEELTIVREVGDGPTLGWALNQAGRMATLDGDYAVGLPLIEEGIRLARAERIGLLEAFLILGLGYAAYFQGDHSTAWAYNERARTLAHELGNPTANAMALAALGLVAIEQSAFAQANSLFVASLEERQRVGDDGTMPFMLSCFAGLAAARHDYWQALLLGGAADALRQALGCQAPDSYLRVVEQHLTTARDALDQHVAATAWAAGQALRAEQAVELALKPGGAAVAPQLHESRKRLDGPMRTLTPREQQVARLLAEGLPTGRLRAGWSSRSAPRLRMSSIFWTSSDWPRATRSAHRQQSTSGRVESIGSMAGLPIFWRDGRLPMAA